MTHHPAISVAIPIYNEEGNIEELYHRLTKALAAISKDYEIVIVNDGSSDGTLGKLLALQKSDRYLKIISLSRNFGHEAAVTAAMDHTTGEVVVVMDGDLQDAPEFIPKMITKLNEGYDVVFAKHPKRNDGLLKNLLFRSFYLTLDKISSYKVPLDAGAFSVMRRPVVDVLSSLSERNRYVAGLRAWVGFKQYGLNYEKQSRYAGKPVQTWQKYFRMAFDALFSFSYVPLRLAMIIGLVVSFFAFLAILQVLYQKLVAGTAILGWASPLISILFIGGVQLIILGVIGEYLGRIYDEVKRRPYYIVSDKVGF